MRKGRWISLPAVMMVVAVFAIAAMHSPSLAGEGQYWRRVNQDDESVELSGRWLGSQGDEYHMGEEATSSRAAAYAEFTFRGTGVRWIGPRGPNRGQADVYLNGELVAEAVDTYGPEMGYQAVLFERTGLEDGEHVLRVDPTGEQHEDSIMNIVGIEAFEYVASIDEWRADLEGLIGEARETAEQARVAPPEEYGYHITPYYPEDARDALLETVGEAEAVLADEESELEAVYDTLKVLQGELEDFRASEIEIKYRATGRGDAEIEIDGRLEEPIWDEAYWYPINPETSHMETGTWGDYRGAFAVLYDDDHLYLAYEAIDEILLAERSGDSIWMDDCVEVWFDWKDAGEMNRSGYYQLGLAPSSADNEPAVWAWRTVDDAASERAREAIDLAATETDEGWIIEARIALEGMEGADPLPGEVTFNISIVNRDVPGEGGDEHWNHITWSGDYHGAHHDPPAWSILTFE